MTRTLAAIACGFLAVPVWAGNLTQITVAAGSSSGQIFGPPACDGNAYKLVAATINGSVTHTYLFIASAPPAIDAWLITDTNQIIGEVHRITATKPGSNPPLNYWEGERDFGNDSVYVGQMWVMALCYGNNEPGTTIEPYANRLYEEHTMRCFAGALP